jgi:hypothetical protein
MSFISRIRDGLDRIRGADLGDASDVSTRTDLPLDHQLTFRSDAGDTWQFDGHHVLQDGEDVEEKVDHPKAGVRDWEDVSARLAIYKNVVQRRAPSRFARLAAAIDRIHGRILFHMKRVFDEKMGAVQLRWGDGRALLNNVNIRALMALYHVRPTEKARRYLDGLKTKLGLILSGAHASPAYARVQGLAQDLYDEITDSLAVPTIDRPRLPQRSSARTV